MANQETQLPNGKVLVMEAQKEGWRYVYVLDKQGRKSDERMIGAGSEASLHLLNTAIAEIVAKNS